MLIIEGGNTQTFIPGDNKNEIADKSSSDSLRASGGGCRFGIGRNSGETLSKTIYTYIQGTAYVIAGIAGLVFMLKVFFFKQMLSECVPWFAACVGCASVGFFVNMIFGKTI